MRCNNCGYENNNEAKFCNECGTKLSKTNEEETYITNEQFTRVDEQSAKENSIGYKTKIYDLLKRRKIIITIIPVIVIIALIITISIKNPNPQEVFNNFSTDENIALQQYDKLSDKDKDTVNNLVKNDIKKLYDTETADHEKDYSNISEEIRKYKGIEELSSYFEDTRAEANLRYDYYAIVKKINDKGGVKNIDIRETYEYIQKINSIPTDAKYYKDAQLTYAILVDRYNNSGNKKIDINKVKPYIGMSKTEVMYLSTWGKPKDINKTTNVYGTHEQWVYSLNRYLYFDDDKLTSIQD